MTYIKSGAIIFNHQFQPVSGLLQTDSHNGVIRPSFDKFLTESTNDEAVKIAKHFVAMFLPKKTALNKNNIRQFLTGDIENIKNNFRLAKIKIFSNSGEIIFSSDPKEIGNLNNQRYFHEIVAKGKVITNGIQKETKSLEGQLMSVDVVETYVPLMNDGIFQGAFEIYYDITARKKQLDKLLSRSSTLNYSENKRCSLPLDKT